MLTRTVSTVLGAVRSIVSRPCVAGLAAVAFLGATPAYASVTLQIEVTSNGAPLLEAGPIALPLMSENGNTQVYSAADLPELSGQSEFVLGGTVTLNTNIYESGLRLSPNLSISSTGATDLEFNIRLVMPASHAGGVNWNTTAAWHLINSGMVFSLPGSSMWTVWMDTEVVGALFDDPSGLAGAVDAIMTTDPINGQGSPLGSQLITDLVFSLTSGTLITAQGAMLLTPCQSCPGDTDCNGAVGVEDLLAMLAAWGTSDPVFDLAPAGGDGVVDVGDLLALLAGWGNCP